MFHVCISHCMRKSTKCQNVTILVSSCGALQLVQGTELTINRNCRFDSIEPDTLFFFGRVMHISHFQCPVV